MKLEASMDYIVVPGDQTLPCKPLRNEEMGNTFLGFMLYKQQTISN